MATSGTGTPSANEPKEDQTGVGSTVGGGPPADGQDLGATTGASDTAGAQEAQEAAAAALREEEARIRADMETSRLSRFTGDVSARQEIIRSIRERRTAVEAKIDADRRELAELIERGSEYLSPGQIRRIVQCLEGTSEEPLAMLQGLDREIRQLVRDNPEAEPSAIGEAAEEAVRTIVAQAIKSKELARQRGQLVAGATYLDRRRSMQLLSPRENARESIPGAPTGMTLRRDNPEVQEADEYVCQVSTWLKQAIDTRRAEAIKSYRRALHSGLLRLEDAATRAAQARRWDLSLVDVLMQDVEGSTADLLKEAGRMVQELAGESRRNWETRARNQAMRVMHVASEAYKALSSRQWTMQDCREYAEELESELKAYRKIADEVKLSELSTKMRQDAKLRQQGIDTEVYRARRQVARIILAHECNLTQPSRTAPRRNSRSETKSTRGVESAESAGNSGSMDFTVPLDRQSSRRPNQTYVVDGMEGWSQDDVEPPGRNQENDDLSAAGLREGGTRSRGLTVRISEQQERDRPIQPEGASTPLEEVRPTMLDNLAASSIRPDYRRQLEMDTQDSEEDFFFRGSRRYPSRGAGAFSSAGQGAEHPSGVFSSADRNAEQPPRPPPQRQSRPEPPQQERQEQQWDPPEQSQNQDRGRREEQSRRSQESQYQRGAEPPPGRERRRSSGAGGGGGGYDSDSDDDLGYRPPNRSRSGGGSGGGSGNRGRRGASPGQNAAGGGAGGAPAPPPPAGGGGGAGAGGPPLDGFGGFAQGLTNAMNAIANQVIRASGKSVKNGGWPYFNSTFKEYPSFKRKFRTYQANYHQATPQRELAQMFRENCLPDKIAIRIKKAEDMLTAWRILDAIYDNPLAFIKDLMQEIRAVPEFREEECEKMMEYYMLLQSHIAKADKADI
jgi:hypothetical protein